MSFRELRPPVGPLQDDSFRRGVQAPFCCPRWRTCLLKGCGRQFCPSCGRRHYCSDPCRKAGGSGPSRKCRRSTALARRGGSADGTEPPLAGAATRQGTTAEKPFRQARAGSAWVISRKKILATGRAVTRVLRPRHARPGSGSVLPCVARLCGARGRGRNVGGRAAAAAPWCARWMNCRRGRRRLPTCQLSTWQRKGVFYQREEGRRKTTKYLIQE